MSTQSDSSNSETNQNNSSSDPVLTPRANLKAKFANNQMPTGEDFALLLDAAVIQDSDPIIATGTTVTVMADLDIDDNVTIKGDLSVDGHSHLKTGLTVDTSIDVGADLTVNGESTLSETRITADLHVTGQSTIANIDVDGEVSVTDSVMLSKGGAENITITPSTLDVTDTHGNRNFRLDENGHLSLGVNGTVSAQLHVQQKSNSNDDLFKIEDATANHAHSTGAQSAGHNHSHLVVDSTGNIGVGLDEPECQLDVASELSIGRDSVNNPLAGEPRLAIKVNPGEKALSINNGTEEILSVGDKTLNTHAECAVNLGGSTTIGDTLVVLGQCSHEQSLSITEDLYVTGASTLQGGLQVNETTHLMNDLEVSGPASFTDDVSITKNLTVSGDSDTNTLSSTQVAVGLGTTLATAALHVKQGTTPSLRLENNAADCQLLVDGNIIKAGSAAAETQLMVEGRVDISDQLQVEGAVTANDGARIAGDASIKQKENSHTTALEISSNGENATALEVCHQISETEKVSLLNLGQNGLSLLMEDADNKQLEIGAITTITAPTYVRDSLWVDNTLRVNNDIVAQGTLFIDQTQQAVSVQVEGLRVDSPSFIIKGDNIGIHQPDPTAALDIIGNVKVTGDSLMTGLLDVNHLFKIDSNHVRLDQKGNTVPLVIRGMEPVRRNTSVAGSVQANQQDLAKPGVDISADGVAIGAALEEENLLVHGDTRLWGSTEIDNLTVTNELTADATSTFNDTVNVKAKLDINTTAIDERSDVHITASNNRQRSLRVDGFGAEVPSLLVDGDKVGINTEMPDAALDVVGDAHVSNNLKAGGDLEVDGNVRIKNTLQVQGDSTQQDIIAKGNVAVGVSQANARMHIRDMNGHTQALRIDDGAQKTSLLVDQGRIAIGYDRVQDATLSVDGDVTIAEDLDVKGFVCIDKTLRVDQDAFFDNDITVIRDTELNGQTVIGDIKELCRDLRGEDGTPIARSRPDAQLYVADSRYKEAFRIDSQNNLSLVFAQGKLGIGSGLPRVELDVDGEMRIKGIAEFGSDVEVEGILKARDNVQVFGSFDVSQRAEFGSDVTIRGDLHIDDHVEIDEELLVTGETTLKDKTEIEASLLVKGDVNVESTLTVKDDIVSDKDIVSNKDIRFTGSLSNGVETPNATLHLNHYCNGKNQNGKNQSVKDSLIVDSNAGSTVTRHLTLDASGQLGLGTDLPAATLDVKGGAIIREDLTVDDVTVSNSLVTNHLAASHIVVNDSLRANTLELGESIRLGQGVSIHEISTDSELGGAQSKDTILATQKAVKDYIDQHKSGLNNIGEVITVSNQKEFDHVFNNGNSTAIKANTAILLLPLFRSYQLKNRVRLEKNVSISGFNSKATRIIKHSADVHFRIVGEINEPITGIELSGFSFDGADLVRRDEESHNGGAFYLQNAQHCQLNCVIERHRCRGNGGAIYADNAQGSDDNVSHIEALYIQYCHAEAIDRNSGRGGAAYGLYRSKIKAHHCTASRGGAVAYCRASEVEATDCRVDLHGGAAYRCEQLRLQAYDCKTASNGKGGAAYFCPDLIAEGMWMGNEASSGMNIYAVSNSKESSESYYWKGDYLGRRLECDHGVWQNYNI